MSVEEHPTVEEGFSSGAGTGAPPLAGEPDGFSSPTLELLAAALAKAQGEIVSAELDALNPAFKADGKPQGTRYATLASVWSACRKPLSENGLSVMQIVRKLDGGMVLVTRLTHSSGQWVASLYPVEPERKSPQGYGSALTYAKKYTLAALVGVAAGDDDDDGNAAHADPRDPGTKRRPTPAATDPATLERWREQLAGAPTLDVLKRVVKGILDEGTPDDLAALREVKTARERQLKAKAETANGCDGRHPAPMCADVMCHLNRPPAGA